MQQKKNLQFTIYFVFEFLLMTLYVRTKCYKPICVWLYVQHEPYINVLIDIGASTENIRTIGYCMRAV